MDVAPVYCFGHISTGQILRVDGSYPAPNGYAEISETAENYCGEATGTALVLQRLGVDTMLEGNWIGDNPAGKRTIEFLSSRGIDCSGLRIEPGYEGVNEIVITDKTTRTVFGRYQDLLFTTPQWDQPSLDVIRRSRLVCVDPGFGETSLKVAAAARDAGLPMVTCDAPPDSPLTRSAAIIAMSKEGLSWHEGLEDHRAAFETYCQACPGLVVFTRGAEGAWWGRGEVRGEVPGFAIDVIDTAGAGDSFRGGLIYGLLQGWDDDRTVRFACAVAARICQSFPGAVNGPTLKEVEELLNR